MADGTKIEWAHDTFNPWEGCTRISPACDHCYAADRAHRFGNDNLWAGQLRRTSPANWRKPLRWNEEARLAGKPRRVFCASLADVFDNQAPQEWREALWNLIALTPCLTWMLLTKRPQNIARMVPGSWMGGFRFPANVWVGATIENRKAIIDRHHYLRSIPARVRFWSCEPLLEDLGDLFDLLDDLRLVIAGGESGPKARPADGDWYRSLRDQCVDAGVSFLFKQHGEWIGVRDLRHLPGGVGPGFGAFDHCRYDIETESVRVGKKAAGRLLDGVEHDGMPA